ncbi:S-locus glycoprotein domain [Sesbania bispinosa]|nr:S-locus glycoprotein domain [Sesbania bispinosa]
MGTSSFSATLEVFYGPQIPLDLVDPRGLPQLFLHKGNKKVFRSGPWYGQQFKGDPVLNQNPIFKPIFVFDSDEVSYSFETKDNIISRFVLSHSGLIQHFSWNDHHSSWFSEFTIQGDHCDDYGLCGAYGTCNIKSSQICKCLKGFEPRLPQEWKKFQWSGGCVVVRKNSQVCRNGDVFKLFTGMKLPDAAEFHTNYSISIDHCEAECSKNCSCVAYAKLDINASGKGCIAWFGELFDIRDVSVNGQDFYVRVPDSELDSNVDGNKGKKLILLPVTISVASTIVVSALWLIIKKWRRKGGGETDMQIMQFSIGRSRSERNEFELPLFEISNIEAATGNFSIYNKIGEGGFGPVYKGQLPSGQEIAVKRLSESSGQGLQEFKNEAWKVWNEDRALEVMDPLLENQFPTSGALRCIQVGLLCVQQCPEDRPTMSTVLLMLDSESVLLPQPGRPGLYSERCFLETDSSSRGGLNSGSSDITALVEGR